VPPNAKYVRIVTVVCTSLLIACEADEPARQPGPLWALSREAVAGAGDGPDALTQVSGLTVSSDGTVFVAQRQDGLVRAYDRRGRFVGSIGRPGEGPGEFDTPSSLGWRGDTLWVQDSGNRRISFFHADGTFIRSLAFTRADSLTDGRPHIPGHVLADGSVLGIWQAPLHQLAGRGPVSVPLVRFTENGDPTALLGRFERRNQFSMVKKGTSVTYGPQPFSDSQIMGVAPDGSSVLLVTRDAAVSPDRATFGIRRIDPSGHVVLDRRFPYAPIRVRDALVDSTVAAMSDNLGSSGIRTPSAAALRRELREHLYIPRYLTPITSLVLGRDGTIWLRREETGSKTVWWQVLDPGGQVIASLRLPSDLSVYYADRTQLWAVERDELDVPTLVRFRVTPAP
jgi:hypothetical protein